mmetsp:Transcript_9414/g.17117  ORF Transcript_9414/g.17117 Transcript_9414/m.17117 type:complete len:82 (+) Transcript_9414:16-261(+)
MHRAYYVTFHVRTKGTQTAKKLSPVRQGYVQHRVSRNIPGQHKASKRQDDVCFNYGIRKGKRLRQFRESLWQSQKMGDFAA